MPGHATLSTSRIFATPTVTPTATPTATSSIDSYPFFRFRNKPQEWSADGAQQEWEADSNLQGWTAGGRHLATDIRVPIIDSGATGRGILIGMLSALGSAVFIVLVFCLVYFLRFTDRGRILLDRVGRPGQYDDEQAMLRDEAEALETMDDMQRAEYMRAKSFIEQNPPETMQTDISLSQFLAIQEKGVSAWEFEPELEIANCFVEGRTEIEFFDSECTVQSNLPIPKQNEVYYWEAKIFEKPETTALNIGVTTKPYPLFRLPGLHKTSIAYTSSGERRYNQLFKGTSYGPEFVQGDVIGIGYRPRTGTIFFTRNGRKLEDVVHGLKSQNFFPSVGANGPCHVDVNFGQSGFVFIEANVKKWGLAPMTGSLAPPPPYGSEQGSILLEAGGHEAAANAAAAAGLMSQSPYTAVRHGRTNSRFRPVAGNPTSPGPVRSPTDISLAQLVQVTSNEDIGEGTSGGDAGGLGFHYSSLPDRSSSLEPQQAWQSSPQARPQVLQPPPQAGSPPRRSPPQQSPPHIQPPEQTREDADESPPPDYESPQSSPATATHSRDSSRGPAPDSPRPPVPSYDAAMAETREQISEAVSESGLDDLQSVSSASRDVSPLGSERNLLARSSEERP